MIKIILLCIFPLFLTSSWSNAEIYRCTNAQGAVIYTDDPAKMPRDCITDQAVKFHQLNILPEQVNQADTQNVDISAADSATPPVQQEYDPASFASLNGEAETLIQRYAEARRRATFSPLFKHKEAAKTELQELRIQKDNLVSVVNKSSLPGTQKNEILEKLSSMAE
jgi:hypothetical protein